MRWFVEISMRLLFSSNVRQVTLVVFMWELKPFPFSSSSRLTIPITSRSAVDSAMYSASVILLAHIIVQQAYIIMYPVRKWLTGAAMIRPSLRQHSILTLSFYMA